MDRTRFPKKRKPKEHNLLIRWSVTPQELRMPFTYTKPGLRIPLLPRYVKWMPKTY